MSSTFRVTQCLPPLGTRLEPLFIDTMTRRAPAMTNGQVRLQDGQMVETVIIAHGGKHPRTTLCVSSQVRRPYVQSTCIAALVLSRRLQQYSMPQYSMYTMGQGYRARFVHTSYRSRSRYSRFQPAVLICCARSVY